MNKEKYLYYIETGNKHGQILIFTSYNKAFNWMRNCTRLNKEQIKKEIQIAIKFEQDEHYSIFTS